MSSETVVAQGVDRWLSGRIKTARKPLATTPEPDRTTRLVDERNG